PCAYRILRYTEYTQCGHKEFIGETPIDCLDSECWISVKHNPACPRPIGCRCRRYWTQPERVTEGTVPTGLCSNCRRPPFPPRTAPPPTVSPE
ncbi:hypothetical protein DFP72DRAFT_870414, partial [Ephemerocybe angulata]